MAPSLAAATPEVAEATGIAVVTVAGGSRRHGMTANAFCSIALDPPLVSVDHRAHTYGLLQRAGTYAINILGESQRALADRLAGRRRPAQRTYRQLWGGRAPGPSTQDRVSGSRVTRRVLAADGHRPGGAGEVARVCGLRQAALFPRPLPDRLRGSLLRRADAALADHLAHGRRRVEHEAHHRPTRGSPPVLPALPSAQDGLSVGRQGLWADAQHLSAQPLLRGIIGTPPIPAAWLPPPRPDPAAGGGCPSESGRRRAPARPAGTKANPQAVQDRPVLRGQAQRGGRARGVDEPHHAHWVAVGGQDRVDGQRRIGFHAPVRAVVRELPGEAGKRTALEARRLPVGQEHQEPQVGLRQPLRAVGHQVTDGVPHLGHGNPSSRLNSTWFCGKQGAAAKRGWPP